MEAGRAYDFAIIGGGLVGAAIGWGLARAGRRVAVLDEGDVAFRASRGNFALVWVQSKGLGMPEYAAWTKHSSDSWADFAAELLQQTGIDVAFQRPGGFTLCLSDREMESRAEALRRLQDQPGMVRYACEMLDRGAVERMLPMIGPDVVGGSYCPLDGHCNALLLLRALHTGLRQYGATYFPDHIVERIDFRGGGFQLITRHGVIGAERIVLAAGNGNGRLAPMVGLNAPVRPQRGQIIVTERAEPFLHHPTVTIRQTVEGSVMIGDSVEEAGFDDTVGAGILATMADRAVRIFPLLARLNVVRCWAALRVMTPDGFPIYDQSRSCPGAFIATCHSGVTLAANHGLALPGFLADGALPPDCAAFSARRFDVPQAA
jgi:glycine/D-amino acid oxidase-like deaminating enzyme